MIKTKGIYTGAVERKDSVKIDRGFWWPSPVIQAVKKEVQFMLQPWFITASVSQNPRSYSPEWWALYQQLRGLQLKNQITIDGYQFITWWQILELGRRYVLGFVLDKWKFHPRLFYYSNSGGNWHATPWVDWDWISKWDFYRDKNIPLSYEKGMLVVPEFAKFLSSLPQEMGSVPIKNIWILPVFWWSCTMIWQDFVKKNVEMDMRLDGITVTPFLDDVRSFADIFGQNTAWYNQSLWNIRHHFYNLIPNYEIASVRKIGTFQEHHATLATNANMYLFEGYMNHEFIHIKVGQWLDRPDLFWIEDIYYPNKWASAWATRKHSINAWLFTAKPIEYDVQCPKICQNDPRIGRNYIDIRWYIQDNSIIQFLLKHGLITKTWSTWFKPKHTWFKARSK
jgi:hypothetical protein